MRHLAKSLAGSLVIAALLTPASFGQEFPKSERQKAEEARKEADVKATDEAYKATMKRTHNNVDKKTVDPWGNLRTPRAGSNN
jgi:uncharacterized protein with FMN-binding domain